MTVNVNFYDFNGDYNMPSLMKWIFQEYFSKRINPDKSYTEEDLDQIVSDLDMLLTPDFISINRLDKILQVESIDSSIDGYLWVAADGVQNGELDIADLKNIAVMTSYFLHIELDWYVYGLFWLILEQDYEVAKGQTDISGEQILGALDGFLYK